MRKNLGFLTQDRAHRLDLFFQACELGKAGTVASLLQEIFLDETSLCEGVEIAISRFLEPYEQPNIRMNIAYLEVVKTILKHDLTISQICSSRDLKAISSLGSDKELRELYVAGKVQAELGY